MNTGRNSKQTTCLCRDTGGKGKLPAQRTGFNTLDNSGHKTSTQPKRKRTGPVCMEKGFATLPVNSTQAVATVAVRIWFGSHA